MITIDQKIEKINKKIMVLVGFSEEEMQESNTKMLNRKINGGLDELIENEISLVGNEDMMQIINSDKKSWISIEEFKCYKDFITSITPKKKLCLYLIISMRVYILSIIP